MSEDRETPAGAPAAHEESANDPAQAAGVGSPVEENEATTTEVLAAVDRASALSGPDAALDPEPGTGPEALPEASATAVSDVAPADERPTIAEPDELPSAGPSAVVAAPATPGATTTADGNIVISSDHPMAALYMQTPMPPDLRGNRGAGVLIALLATVAFAVLYTGVLALWIAPATPPSRFVEALVDVSLWPVAAASVAFFVGLAVLVLIVGRAGWWAYVLGGFLVGVLVWGAAVVGVAYAGYLSVGSSALAEQIDGAGGSITPLGLIRLFGLNLSVIAAGVVAREITVWFGAWIGARGRRVTRKNAEVLAEYEEALAEAQAKQP